MMTKIKKYIIALLFGSVALAASFYIPQDSSFENLSRVKKIDNKFEVDFREDSRVYIGGSGSSFKPHVKLGKWNNEVEINVWLETDKKIKPKQNRGKLKWKDKKKEIHFYTIDDDKFEFEIILDERPDSNITELKIDSRGLKFYHQPALNIEMAGQDCWTDSCTETDCCDSHRPIEIVGSYAVYHESKAGDYSKMGGKNYRAGKAFHIPYPYLVDANGWKVRAENFKIENNFLTVTAPQNFIDNAVYPVRHAAGLTFGYTTIGGSNWGTATDKILGAKGTPASAGNADSITFYLFSGIYDDGPRKLGLYRISDGIFIEDTAEYSGETPDNWVTHDLETSPSITNVEYAPVHWGAESALKYDTVSGEGVYEDASYPAAWPSPISWAGEDYKFSIYCTYTAGAAPERRIIKIE